MRTWDDVEWLVRADARPAESPVWDVDRGVLWWVDGPAGLVHRFDPANGTDVAVEVGERVGAVALHADGGLVAFVDDGLVRVDPDRGGVTGRVARVDADDDATQANDGKPGPDGAFWGGTMRTDVARGGGALYRVDPSGAEVQTLLTGVSISNGLDWITPTRLAYVDSFGPGVEVLDVDVDAGRVTNRALLAAQPEAGGLYDGLALDAAGDVWVAVNEGSCVLRHSPDGALTGRVEVPTPQVTSVAFGGEGLADLYVTAARCDDGDGGLLRCRVGVAGRAPHRFGA